MKTETENAKKNNKNQRTLTNNIKDIFSIYGSILICLFTFKIHASISFARLNIRTHEISFRFD